MRKILIVSITLCLLIAGLAQANVVISWLADPKANVSDVPDIYLKQKILIEETGDENYALIKAAKITEITSLATTTATTSADFIKIKVLGQDYKVKINKETNVVRYSWVKLSIDLSEFTVGDIINVYGTIDENDPFLIQAKTVRNVSIQKKHANFIGEITSITATSTFSLKTEKHGTLVVSTDANTKIYSSSQLKTFSDLKVGTKVLVRGIWNVTQGTMAAYLIRLYPNEVCVGDCACKTCTDSCRSNCPCKSCNVTTTIPTSTHPTSSIQ